MSCLTGLGEIPDGYGRFQALKYSKPDVTPAKIKRLRMMAESMIPQIRATAAGNPSTPVEVLERLADDRSLSVRSWVARNPNCPSELHFQFAWDEHEDEGLRAFAHWKLTSVEEPESEDE